MKLVFAWIPLAGAASLLALVWVGSALGWLGTPVTCGADGIAVCLQLPKAVSLGIWGAYLGLILMLGVWQVRSFARDALGDQGSL